MVTDTKDLVASGYNEVADAYLDRFGASTTRQRWLDQLAENLPVGGRVLDLGCGAGVPVAQTLVGLGHSVVGVDSSYRQIARARLAVPEATFIEADMCELSFGADTFDAVGAFYSMTHVPPDEQAPLIGRIATWLKPQGVLVASFGTGARSEWQGEWLGTAMYFGHAGEDATLTSIADAGLTLRTSAVEKQDNEDADFLWVEAVKGAEAVTRKSIAEN